MMDDQYIKDHSVVERYLTNQLEKEELEEFSCRLMKDTDLQKKVEANRLLFKLLWKTQQEAVSTRQASSRWTWQRLLTIVMALVLLVSLSLWLGRKGETMPTSPPSKTVPLEQPTGENQTETTPSPLNNKEKLPTSEEVEEESLPEEEPKPVPFAANFEPNPLLEGYFTSRRGGVINVTQPSQVTQFTREAGRFVFHLEGKLELEREGEIVLLYFFTNKRADYEEFSPLESAELTLEKTGAAGSFSFQWQKTLEWTSGLYYYLLEGEESGLLYVGKFELR